MRATKIQIQSILSSLQQLSLADRQSIIQSIQSGPTSLLGKPAEGYNDWLCDLRLRGLSHGTIELYSRTVRKLLERYTAPTNRDVRVYLAERLNAVTPTKVRNDQKSLKSFFGFLEEQSMWVSNPTKGTKLMKVAKIIRKAPPQEDVQKLLAAWQGSQNRLRDRLLIAIIVNTGLRISEACSIQRDNLDLKDHFTVISPVK